MLLHLLGREGQTRFEVLTAVTMKKSAFWDVAPCRSGVSWRNGGTYHILHHGRKKNMVIWGFHGGHCDECSLLWMLFGVDVVLVDVSQERISSIFMAERETWLDLRFSPRWLKKTAFWDVAICQCLARCFGRTYLLHLQGISEYK